MKKVPVILHIPHSSLLIPKDFREDIRLSGPELETELRLMTDAYTEKAATGDWAACVLTAPVSRLVVDVERFRDDLAESMSRVGMGAVYEKSQVGKVMRLVTIERREAMLRRFYDPHHAAFADSVAEMLKQMDQCLIIDVHSFPSSPLVYEADQSPERPEICIGTDVYHTPRHLANAAMMFFGEREFMVEENRPFSGSIVPSAYYEKDKRVCSIMVEIRRDLIMDELTGARKESAAEVFGLFPAFARRLIEIRPEKLFFKEE